MRDRSGPLARVSFAYLVVLPVSGPDVPGRRTVAAPVFEAEVPSQRSIQFELWEKRPFWLFPVGVKPPDTNRREPHSAPDTVENKMVVRIRRDRRSGDAD
jgi:hypothetical protein